MRVTFEESSEVKDCEKGPKKSLRKCPTIIQKWKENSTYCTKANKTPSMQKKIIMFKIIDILSQELVGFLFH